METEEEIDELPSVAAELIGTVLQDSVELFAFFDADEDKESTYSVEDVDGSLHDDDDFVEQANVPAEVAMTSDVISTAQKEIDEAPAVLLQSSFCQKATFEEGDASWGGWAPSHDLFGDRPFERYFQSFGHAAVLQADANVPSLASMEMDQPCLGPAEEEFAMEGCLSEDFVSFVGALEADISANLAACKIQWTFRMMQEWRQIQLQQWEMRAMAVNRGVRCQDQAASKIQHAWREMQIWRQVQLRLWEQRADALNGAVRCPQQAAGQIQRAFRRSQARRQEAMQKAKQRFEAERGFASKNGTTLAQVLCPEVEFGRSALDSSETAVGARPDELDGEELANVWASFCDLFKLAQDDAATAIQKAWRSHRQRKRPMLLQAQPQPRICCPITRMLEAMKALQDAAREDAAKRIQKQYRAMRSARKACNATQVATCFIEFQIEQMNLAKPKKGEDEAARCLQQAFRSFRLHKAAKQIRAQFAVEASKVVVPATTFTPLPPSAPKGMSCRRPSTRAARMTVEAPTAPSTKSQQRPSGRKAGQPSTQASSASASSPISPTAPSSVETKPSQSPRRRPPCIGVPESFKLDDPKFSPVNADGHDISNEFAALGSEIFNISTPRSKGSRSTTSPVSLKNLRSTGTMLGAESPRWNRTSASPFGKRVASLTRPSQEPMSPRTPRGSTRVGALLPDIAMAQRSNGENTARMLQAITKKTML
jgi:hypothetical protein